MTTRLAVALWTLAVLATVGACTLILTSDHVGPRTGRAVLATAAGLAFVAAGLVSRLRRPDSRVAAIMVAVGFAWFLGALTQANEPVVFSLGAALNDLPWAFFGYLVLAYPSGRLRAAVDKAIVGAAFVATLVLRPLWTLVADLDEAYPEAPENAFLVDAEPRLADAIETSIQMIALALIAATITLLVRRWRAASLPVRRTLSPVYLTFGATVALLAVAVVVDVTFGSAASDGVFWVALAALMTVPLSFAVGLLRTRLAHAGVSSLLVELDRVRRAGDLRDALARGLGDPSLDVAYWLPERREWVDGDGAPVELPADEGRRAATVVERGGRPVAALVHDAQLREDRDLVDAVAAAAALALENERRLTELAQADARQRAFLDALPDLMFRYSRDGTYLDVEGRDADLVLPRHELLGRKIRDVLPADVAERLMAPVECVRPGAVETVEYRLRLSGVDRHFEARIAAITDEEVVVIVRDISDRKRNEAQLQRLQDELRVRLDDLQRERDFIRAVVQAAPSFFCLVDPEGRIVRFNRSLELASGFVDDETVRGARFWDVFVVADERDAVRELLLRACFECRETTPERENHFVARDGGRLAVAWSATPLFDEKGEPRFLVTGMDVTLRNRHERELRRSRARIVEAGDVERRRLERNLHDGAQQRLVSISLTLRLAQAAVRSDPARAEALLGTASEELGRALEELRELARGIHPAVLTDRGLAPALESLVTRSPVPVTVAEAPGQRLPEPVEAAAYYVVSEALANVAKYAQASEATVRISRNDGRAVIEVADDGVGGADPALGSGLRGLADRVEALDGRLEVASAPGAGTTIRAEIPV